MSVLSDDGPSTNPRSLASLTLVTLGQSLRAPTSLGLPCITCPHSLRDPRDRPHPRDLPPPPYLPDPPDPPDPRDPPDPPSLPDPDQSEPLLPVRQQLVDAPGRRRGDLEPPGRLAVGGVHQLAVADEIDQAECGDAGLSRPEEVPRAAQLQIALGDL